MPTLAHNSIAIRVSVERYHFGMALRPGDPRMNIQLTKGSAESLETVIIKFLITKKYDLVDTEGFLQLFDLGVAQLSRQVCARNLSAQIGRHRRHIDRFELHDFTSPCDYSSYHESTQFKH